MINHEALADDRSAITHLIDPGELEQYRADLEEWKTTFGPGGQHLRPPVDMIIRTPKNLIITIPAFFSWMRDNHRGPWAPPRQEVVTVAGGFHVGDVVSYDSSFLGGTQTRTVVPKPAASTLSDRDRIWIRDENGSIGWLETERFTLVSCPHHTDPDPAHPADEQPAPEGYIPWGPGHPDWESFWAKADQVATEAGYCGEYQHMADRLGRSTREQVGYVVTLLVDVVGPRGFVISQREAERAVETLVGTVIRGDVAVRSVHLNSVQNNNDRQPASGD